MKNKNKYDKTLNKIQASADTGPQKLYKQWEDFCNYLMSTNRFVLNKSHQQFIKFIIKSAKNRQRTITKDTTTFWRARIGPGLIEKNGEIINEPIPKKEMGAPPADKCNAGRANCEGIPHLYLSDKWETALAETRPYINAYVTLCEFKLNTNISVVDLLTDNYPVRGKNKRNEYYFWIMTIRQYFSVPINPADKKIWYIPTQYITELLKNEGYDGIRYKSSQRQHGFNVVLFNSKKAAPLKTKVKKVHDIEFITDPWHEVKKHLHPRPK